MQDERRAKAQTEKRKAGTAAHSCFSGISGCVWGRPGLSSGEVFSDTENRYLAKKPEWTPEAFLDGSYGEDYEKYLSDQFR